MSNNLIDFRSPACIQAMPLENYSTLNEFPLFPMLGIPLAWPKKRFLFQFSFNMHTPFSIEPRANLIFHSRDAGASPAKPGVCLTVSNIKRWRLDISPFSTMEDYLSQLIRWHKGNYLKSESKFESYGCTLKINDGDWSDLAESAYRLYGNVANRHGRRLYDLNFFHQAAKRPDYRLLTAWFEGEMIGALLLQEEPPTLHCVACGLDYHHSSPSNSYSWLHYGMIRWAIESGRFKQVDAGLTADESKKRIGFQPVETSIDIYSNKQVAGFLLKVLGSVVTMRLTAESKVEWQLRR